MIVHICVTEKARRAALRKSSLFHVVKGRRLVIVEGWKVVAVKSAYYY